VIETATKPFDWDALVAPIESAATPARARSAVWTVLRGLRSHHWRLNVPDQRQEYLNIMQLVDSCSWAAGLTREFREHALNTDAARRGARWHAMLDHQDLAISK
jgi:hypothetical protein